MHSIYLIRQQKVNEPLPIVRVLQGVLHYRKYSPPNNAPDVNATGYGENTNVGEAVQSEKLTIEKEPEEQVPRRTHYLLFPVRHPSPYLFGINDR